MLNGISTGTTRLTRSRCGAMAALVVVALATLGGCAGRNSDMPMPPEVRLREASGYFEAGNTAYRAKRNDEAIENYQRAVETYKELPYAWNNLGKAVLERDQQGDKMYAADCFKMAADLDRTDWRPVANIGSIYHKLGYLDDAAKWYSLALEREPNAEPALLNSILVDHLRDQRTEETAARIRRALLLVTDPEWQAYLRRQREIVHGRLLESRTSVGQP
ncbi:MAG: tetratricopeptide repeat protein [Phycisphaerales bacterium]|nr:tetratricopeptide repeat protein [Phycisphaerales bacterium]